MRPVEDRLRKLAEAGELSRLAGEGAPFAAEPPDHAGDRWAAFHILAINKVLPDWAELRREIEADHAALARRARQHLEWSHERRRLLRDLSAERILDEARVSRERDSRVRREIAEGVAALNEKVGTYNALVPVPRLQLLPFSAERIFEVAAER